MDLANRLKKMRKINKTSQKKLAKVLNIAQSTISQWEAGFSKPDYDDIVNLCEFFDCSADFMMGQSDERGSYPKKYSALTDQQELLINTFNNLTDDKRDIILSTIYAFEI